MSEPMKKQPQKRKLMVMIQPHNDALNHSRNVLLQGDNACVNDKMESFWGGKYECMISASWNSHKEKSGRSFIGMRCL